MQRPIPDEDTGNEGRKGLVDQDVPLAAKHPTDPTEKDASKQAKDRGVDEASKESYPASDAPAW